MSNTSKGRGIKGSKLWIQNLVNDSKGAKLTEAIQKVDSSIGKITWLSPLESHNYEELKTQNIEGITKRMLAFWPEHGPQWDAVGKAGDTLILVEAKGHVAETNSKCTASSEKSKELIEKTLKEVHKKLGATTEFDETYWLRKYYQLSNRLAFLVKLKEQGLKVKLVLLNIVEDYGHIPTEQKEWENHYKYVFEKLLGQEKIPNDVVNVYYKETVYL